MMEMLIQSHMLVIVSVKAVIVYCVMHIQSVVEEVFRSSIYSEVLH